MPLTSIGIASFVLSLAGSLIGVFFGKRFHLRVEIFGGLVLIGIGIKILVEHLLFCNKIMNKNNLKWQLPFLVLLIVGTVLILRKQSPYQTDQDW